MTKGARSAPPATRKEKLTSCKSAIYTSNTTATPITLTAAQPTATLPLGTTVRRFGRNLQLSGNGILAEGEGYYDLDVSIGFTPTTAGDYTFTLLRDGVPVQGARRTVTGAAAASAVVEFPAIDRLQCCSTTANYTLQVSTAAALPASLTVNNVGMTVNKL